MLIKYHGQLCEINTELEPGEAELDVFKDDDLEDTIEFTSDSLGDTIEIETDKVIAASKDNKDV